MNSKTKIYPVEVELTEKFLELNPTLKSIYKNGKLNLEINSAIKKEFAETISEIIGDLRPREISLFNPFLNAINELAENDSFIETAIPVKKEDESKEEFNLKIKDWEKENTESLKRINSAIRTFNGALTKSKKEIKEPYSSVIKKIDTLYNSLKEFSDDRKDKSQKNFSTLLSKIEEDKLEKERKAKEVELEQIRDLENKNNEANEKLAEATSKNKFADCISMVTSFFNNQEQKLNNLNISGLIQLKEEVSSKEFDLTHLGDMEQASLLGTIKMLREALNSKIDGNINSESNSIETTAEAEEVEKNIEDADLRVFALMLNKLNIAKTQIDSINSDFTDEKMKELSDILSNQFTTLGSNISKLIAYCEKKEQIYKSLK